MPSLTNFTLVQITSKDLDSTYAVAFEPKMLEHIQKQSQSKENNPPNVLVEL